MEENLILTRESVPSDIERYFRGVLALDQQDKVFSVNLDDVWQLVYSERGKAVKALKQNFIDNVDYISIAQSGKTATGGFKKIDYYLTSACLEYFVARKVRPVFEVYRRVFPSCSCASSAAIFAGADSSQPHVCGLGYQDPQHQ